ncbi:glutamate--cysteine ligase [Streptantibioticus rubrisoli]|uniref:Putative glutamate--cysteine ligase 2 n=1 Tax=Streptantibioticus rubrisoli TaxID=1387313 RepID=A0ABT1PJ56_9ACTN|nr:glutamate--cysteine ligase [Streptantibioticus rubrisoli]MCQ4045399.1 glutamate--cysteine ligase [Streptantibioticus rubrisoli]
MTLTERQALMTEPGFRPSAKPLMGVEEEYLVVDPATRAVATGSAMVVKRAAVDLGDAVTPEMGLVQVETRTPPCAEQADLLRHLRKNRAVVAAAAATEGLGAVATATAVLSGAIPQQITQNRRYRAQLETYRALVDEQVLCASQVHTCVPDREQAVLVSNHLRPWIPALIALSANSPFHEGRDTRYASWRWPHWQRWPVSGPPPYFRSLREHDDLVDALQDAGALADRRTVFWDVRLSTRYPTLEVRACDVPVTAEESALLAAVIRALVVTAVRAVERGDPGPDLPAALLRAACWRAARDELAAAGVDPRTGRATAPGTLADALLRHIRPALEELGDEQTVTEALRRLRAVGPGAVRQRAAYTRRGRLTDVVDYLLAQTPTGTL